jgi:integrase
MSQKIDPYASAKIQAASHPRYKWRVVYYDPGDLEGGKKRKYFASKSECHGWIEGDYAEMLERGYNPSTALTFRGAVRFYQEIGESSGISGREPMTKGTLDRIKVHERNYLQDWRHYDEPIDDTPEEVCFEFMRQIGKQRKYSASKAAQTLKAATAFAKQERRCRTDPFYGTRTPPLRSKEEDRATTNSEIPTAQQLKDILELIRRKASRGREDSRRQWSSIYCMVMLAASCGLRSGEFICLRRENIDLSAGKVHVVESLESGSVSNVKKPKTKAGIRSIPMSPELTGVLRDYLDTYEVPPTGRAFTTRNGTMYRRNNLQKRLRSLREELDIPDIGFHGFRHYYASILIKKKVDAKALTYLLGHEDYAFTVSVYGHLMEDSISPDLAITL